MRQRSGWFVSMRSVWELLAVVGVLALTSAAPVAAQGYSTAALVNSNNNECREVPDCRSSIMPAVAVPARGSISSRFVCPESHPNLWTWDVRLHEHVGVTLAKIDRTSAIIEGTNHSDAEGHLIVYLGCSTIPSTGDAVLVLRRVAPTGWVGPDARRPNASYPSQ
jgi:hypothetical protein